MVLILIKQIIITIMIILIIIMITITMIIIMIMTHICPFPRTIIMIIMMI